MSEGGRELLRGVDEEVLAVAMFLLSPLLPVVRRVPTTTTILSLLLSHHHQTPSLESFQELRGKPSMHVIAYEARFTLIPEENRCLSLEYLVCRAVEEFPLGSSFYASSLVVGAQLLNGRSRS